VIGDDGADLPHRNPWANGPAIFLAHEAPAPCQRAIGSVRIVEIGGTSPACSASAVSISANVCLDGRSALST
jgi:hypothetical protein